MSQKPYDHRMYCSNCLGEDKNQSLDQTTSTVAVELNPPLNKKKKVKKARVSTICTTNCRYELIRSTARKLGMKEGPEGWNIYWTDLSISVERCKDMKRFQRINHFPGMLELCRKDLLARNLNRMFKLFPLEYNIFPKTWCLPTELPDLLEYAKAYKNKTFIVKPDFGCQGRGISLTKNIKDLRSYERMICQTYISRPFLIDGFKFDLRVYTLLTSCDPVRIFVYNEGLARFATTKYKDPCSSNINNMYMHLTNYSVNKHSRTYIVDDVEGSKRRFSSINKWFTTNSYDSEKIWGSIDDVIIKTIMMVIPTLRHCYTACFPSQPDMQACFELLGFDFMLDHKLKPYLLEVNHSPSFHTDTPIDHEIKEALIYDTFVLLNLGQNDKIKVLLDEKRKILGRLNPAKVPPMNKEYCEQVLNARMNWESTHLGNYRKVYPCNNAEKYENFICQNASTLFNDTYASKARELAGKQLREELQEKFTLQQRYLNNANQMKQQTIPKPVLKEEKHSPKTQPRKNPFSFEPTYIDDQDELERISSMAKREFLIHSYGILEKLYADLNKAGQRRLMDQITYSRTNNWNKAEAEQDLYNTKKKQFNDNITDILKCISKKPDITHNEKAKLSSIFLDPPQVKGEKRSYLEPYGSEVEKVNEKKTENVHSCNIERSDSIFVSDMP